MPVSKRQRAFAFLLYPESAPADWLDRLRDLHVPIAVSPLHDRDVFTADKDGHKAGEIKKPHYHVMMCFSGKKSLEQVYQMLAGLLIKHVEPIDDARGYCRYLTHMDDADKAQYNPADIITISGFDYAGLMAPTKAQTDQIRSEVLSWIRETDCVNYCDLVYFCHDVEPDWLDYVEHHTMFLAEVIKGQWRKAGGASSSPRTGRRATAAGRIEICFTACGAAERNPEFQKKPKRLAWAFLFPRLARPRSAGRRNLLARALVNSEGHAARYNFGDGCAILCMAKRIQNWTSVLSCTRCFVYTKLHLAPIFILLILTLAGAGR